MVILLEDPMATLLEDPMVTLLEDLITTQLKGRIAILQEGRRQVIINPIVDHHHLQEAPAFLNHLDLGQVRVHQEVVEDVRIIKH